MNRRSFLKTLLGSLVAIVAGPHLPKSVLPPSLETVVSLVPYYVAVYEHGIFSFSRSGRLISRTVFPESISVVDDVVISYTLNLETGGVSDVRRES